MLQVVHTVVDCCVNTAINDFVENSALISYGVFTR